MRKALKSRRGTTLMVTGLMITGLTAFMGLAVDTGYLSSVKSQMQTAADAAAGAGALELRAGSQSSVVITASKEASRVNGFQDSANSTTVTVNSPPTSGNYNGDANAVEVIVSRNVSTYFFRIVGQNSVTVRARAVARKSTANAAAAACLVALDGSGQRTFYLGGQSLVTTDCGIHVNSSSSQAVYFDGFACTTASAFNIVTGATMGPDAGQWPYQGGCATSPRSFLQKPGVQTLTATTGGAIADPLATLAPPTVGACTVNSQLTIHSNTAPLNQQITLNPGVYCGGIRIDGRNVRFNPGIYVLRGGPLDVVSSSSSVSGTGVAFYSTTSASAPTNYSTVGRFLFSSNGVSVDFTAPTSGQMNGVLFYVDRNAPASIGAHEVNGNANASRFNGIIYAKNQELRVTGSNSRLTITSNSKVVVGKVNVNGQARLTLTTGQSSGSGGSNSQTIIVSE